MLAGVSAPMPAWSDCGAPATPVHDIQGPGSQSPMLGETVTVEGILTRDARYPGGFDGFYLQQADAETDDNPATSEALFVYTRKTRGQPGQRLRVTGTVKEYHGLTELVAIQTLSVCGQGQLPDAIDVSLPWPQAPESLENMRVRFHQPLTIVDHYNLAVYGELTLAAEDQVTATEYRAPGPEAAARNQYNREHRVTLDDGRAVRQPDPIPWPPAGLSYHRTLRTGDTVSGLHGVLDFRFDQWRLQPSRAPEFHITNPRPEAPAPVPEGAIRVMTLNLQNYFNGDGGGSGFPTARGAQTLEQFRAQQARLTHAITQAGPDILAVSELESDGYGANSATAQLSGALGSNWHFIATPGDDGSDEIRTGLLYRSDRVQPVGPANRLQTGIYARQGRPPLAQAFQVNDRGETLRVVAPHLKSKSCRNAKQGNADQNDGQGCFNQRRTREAIAITQWLASLPKTNNLMGTLIAGDLNSYARETPLQQFESAGYRSLVHHFQTCTSHACPHHSYRYQGMKGSLDYLLASGALIDQVIGARSWNINADEPRALAYPDTTTGSGPWRASDHNPMITDIRVQSR